MPSSKLFNAKLIYLAASLLLIVFGLAAVSSAPVYSQNQRLLCQQLGQGYDQSTDSCVESPGDDAEGQAQGVIETVLNILSIVVTVASVIMIIIGGIRYALSGGESAQTASAKNTIIFALVGLAIVAFAQVIVVFVLSRV